MDIYLYCLKPANIENLYAYMYILIKATNICHVKRKISFTFLYT